MSLDTNDPHVVEPGHAPTPFTAEEIRRGCPAGRTIRLLAEAADSKALRTIRFVECNESGALQERAQFSIEGEALGSVEVNWSSWAELQAHASFPTGRVSISEDTLDIPIGRVECLRYTVTDGSTVQTYWFAKERPGMPVRYTSENDGELASAVTMIGDESAMRAGS